MTLRKREDTTLQYRIEIFLGIVKALFFFKNYLLTSERYIMCPFHSLSCLVRPRNCEKRVLAPPSMSIRPSVRMEHLSSHWTDFHEI